MPTKRVAPKPAQPIHKSSNHGHASFAALIWIAVIAATFSFAGISLSAMAKEVPAQRPAQAYNLKAEIKKISDRLERIEKKLDAHTTSTQQ